MSFSREDRPCGRCGAPGPWTRDREQLDLIEDVVTVFETCGACGAEYLLNLGPPRSGLLPFSEPQTRDENEKGS